MTIKEAMQLTDAQFWLEVSRAITPGPWQHDYRYCYDGRYHCLRCNCYEKIVDLYEDKHLNPALPAPCPIPPPLKDPPEVLAFRLRDRALQQAGIQKIEMAVQQLLGGANTLSDSLLRHHYMAYTATPREQVTCCLVALGLWEATP